MVSGAGKSALSFNTALKKPLGNRGLFFVEFKLRDEGDGLLFRLVEKKDLCKNT